jgi:hypothetical protein
MKKKMRFITIMLIIVMLIVVNSTTVFASTSNNVTLKDSDSTALKNASNVSYNCTLNMKSTVTGGATGLLGPYTVTSKGTLTGSWPGVNPAYCEKLKYENTYSFSGVGTISLTVGTSGGSLSGSTTSTSRTVSETYTKAEYPKLYKLDETISCKATRANIYWHYQSASATYTISVNGNPRSASCSVAADTVIW